MAAAAPADRWKGRVSVIVPVYNEAEHLDELLSADPTALAHVIQRSCEIKAQIVELLREFEIPAETRIVSAHRTPDLLFQYASEAESRGLIDGHARAHPRFQRLEALRSGFGLDEASRVNGNHRC